ncbi:MAG: alpha/beta hydrolase [Flavobacteriaceae bacterium]|nr:alpha/beta hydrolase [Flavobacteriaceae bacterium]
MPNQTMEINADKIPVYFMPGMAASPAIFERVHLPDALFTKHLLAWEIPNKKEHLASYARSMANKIRHHNPVLVGVSFGGILVQEISKYIPTRKVIIISSVKHQNELPKKFKFAQLTKAHKLFPTGLVANIEILHGLAFGETFQKKLNMYERYLSVRDKTYLDWAIETLVNWEQTNVPKNLIHIQGTEDKVFPIANISNCIPIEGGGHAMVITHAGILNELLPEMILKT